MANSITGTQPPAVVNGAQQVSVDQFPQTSFHSFAGVGFEQHPLASFQGMLNGAADGNIAHYTAYVNWGDSSTWETAGIAPRPVNAAAPFLVKGSHVYSAVGTFPVVVFLQGSDGTSTSAQMTSVTVDPLASGLVGTKPAAVAPAQSPSDVDVNLVGNTINTAYVNRGFVNQEVARLTSFVDDVRVTDPLLVHA